MNNKKKKKWYVPVIIVVVLIAWIGNLTGKDEEPAQEPEQPAMVQEEVQKEVEAVEYEVINQEEQGLATDRGKSFWVVVDPSATDEQLIQVFNELYPKDLKWGTVFFFDKKEDIEAGNPYTVAMLERKGSLGKPKIER